LQKLKEALGFLRTMDRELLTVAERIEEFRRTRDELNRTFKETFALDRQNEELRTENRADIDAAQKALAKQVEKEVKDLHRSKSEMMRGFPSVFRVPTEKLPRVLGFLELYKDLARIDSLLRSARQSTSPGASPRPSAEARMDLQEARNGLRELRDSLSQVGERVSGGVFDEIESALETFDTTIDELKPGSRLGAERLQDRIRELERSKKRMIGHFPTVLGLRFRWLFLQLEGLNNRFELIEKFSATESFTAMEHLRAARREIEALEKALRDSGP